MAPTLQSISEVRFKKIEIILIDYLDILTPSTHLVDEAGARMFSFSENDRIGLQRLKSAGAQLVLVQPENLPLHKAFHVCFDRVFTVDRTDVDFNFVDLLEKLSTPCERIACLTADARSVEQIRSAPMYADTIVYTADDSDEFVKKRSSCISHQKAGEGVLLELSRIFSENKRNIQPEISIIIPAYNEENRIQLTLDRYYHYFENIDLPFEIIVVLNGCRDNTLEIVDKFSKYHSRVRYLNIAKPIGKGKAIICGFQAAKGRYVSFTDADGSTYPKELVGLLQNIGDYDGIIASRWMKDSFILIKQPFHRRVLSRLFNLFVRTFLDIPFKDTQCGSKIFKREVVKSIDSDLQVSGFAFDACLLFHIIKKNYAIKEHPIAWSDERKSTLNVLEVSTDVFFSVLKTRFKDLFKNG